MINQSELKRVLDYNKNTGAFTWKNDRGGSAKKGTIAGSVRSDGYRTIGCYSKRYKAHRLAWLYEFGTMPATSLDHINHTRDDNRIINIREAPATDNCRNRSLNHNNNSGVTGVFWDKEFGKWRAAIQIRGKQIYLGRFDNLEDAVAARHDANIKYKFHRNHGIELRQQENRRGYHD